MATKNRNESQFDLYREWQWVKHVTIAKNATPWSEILGSIASRIYVVDGCAGAGGYLNPNTGETERDGSPIIFAKRAREYTSKRGPGKTMHVICVEPNRRNFDLLAKRLEPFANHSTTFHGTLRQHAPTIADRIGAAPALVLLDPIGLKAINPDSWMPLLERQGKTDLFVVLMFPGLHRIGGMLLPDGTADPTKPKAVAAALEMDRVFRTDEWRAIAIDPALKSDRHRVAREEMYVELWLHRVIGDRHPLKAVKPVRAQSSAPVKYWLAMTSAHRKAHGLVNDIMVDLEEIEILREYGTERHVEGFGRTMLDAHRAEIVANIEAATLEALAGTGNEGMPWGALEQILETQFFARAKQNVIWKVVKGMCRGDDGRLRRQKNPGAAADPLEVIRLTSPSDTNPSPNANISPIRRAA